MIGLLEVPPSAALVFVGGINLVTLFRFHSTIHLSRCNGWNGVCLYSAYQLLCVVWKAGLLIPGSWLLSAGLIIHSVMQSHALVSCSASSWLSACIVCVRVRQP